MKNLPFRPPISGEDRETTLQVVREIGTGAAQKFVLGEAVTRLEQQVCRDTGARYGIACGSGTGALALAIDAIGAGRGDEVITPAFSCQAVADTIVNRGATPVFADIDPSALVIDLAAVTAAVSPRTVAIIPAHLFSNLADMPALRSLARHHDLKIVEDAAMAQGASLDGMAAGRWGDAGVFSFSQFKPIGGSGEGGLVLTDDEDIAEKCRLLRNHGQSSCGRREMIGYCSRMDEIVAAFLLYRHSRLAGHIRRKAEVAARYTEAFMPLTDKGLTTARPAGTAGESWCHAYIVLTGRRDELRTHLKSRGIGTHIYYPVPLPNQPAFECYSQGSLFPHAEDVGRRNLALPVWPGLSNDDVTYIIEAVCEFFC